MNGRSGVFWAIRLENIPHRQGGSDDVALALPNVAIQAIMTPPLFAPDEGAHVVRSFAVSQFRLYGARVNTHEPGKSPDPDAFDDAQAFPVSLRSR